MFKLEEVCLENKKYFSRLFNFQEALLSFQQVNKTKRDLEKRKLVGVLKNFKRFQLKIRYNESQMLLLYELTFTRKNEVAWCQRSVFFKIGVKRTVRFKPYF